MNVAIEARALASKSGGIRSYVYELIRHMALLHPENEIEALYSNSSALGTFQGVQETVIPLKSEMFLSHWINVPVSSYLHSKQPAVVHYTKAAIPRRSLLPTVVTIYDIIPILLPETQSFLRRMYWPRVLRHAALYADHIITISQQSKKDIIRHFGISAENITVTPLAVDTKHFYPRPTPEKRTEPYILFVGTWDERKNILSLIRAFEMIADAIPHKLVIAGRPAHKQDTSRRAAQQSRFADRIEFREYIPYNDLPALYSEADMFVWPSIYEGWAFPPQEAMACGTPVIVSNAGPLPEVVENAGIIVPFSTEDLHRRTNDTSFIEHLAEEMRTLALDQSAKDILISKGLNQVQKTTWQDIASKTWSVYEKLAV